MNYSDSLTFAVQHLQDWDIPEHLLPLTICNEAALRSGIPDLRRSALMKAKAGMISLAEMNRVTKD